MRRREFLQVGVSGAVAASSACVCQCAARGAAPDDPAAKVDPDGLARAAVEHFVPGKKTCGESLFMAGCEALGITSDLVPDVALGLAGGIGLQGKTCGTITGSAMVLSLAVASREPDYRKKKMRVLGAVGALYKRFEDEFETTECRKLCGLDLTTAEGRKALEEGVKEQKCRRFVEVAARMLAESLPKA